MMALVKRYDVEVIYKPIDLFTVFSASGGKPVRERPHQRQVYRLIEMERWKAIRTSRLSHGRASIQPIRPSGAECCWPQLQEETTSPPSRTVA